MILFPNATVFESGSVKKCDMQFDGVSLSIFEGDVSSVSHFSSVIPNVNIFPGFLDVHVHLREPGFSYKETIFSGTRAAARGGYTSVCSMPNLNPVPDSVEHLNEQLEIIKRDAAINVYPYGAITVGQGGEALADLSGLAPSVIAFSDDGRGVQSEDLMRCAMMTAKRLGKMIVAHCEDNSLLRGGYIHDGEYAKTHGHRGICSESEWVQIERDLRLVEEIGCAYHICHVSTKESVELIRAAKARGVNVTAETAPHYILLDDTYMEEDGRFKMNPPLRSPEDREAMLHGILDGTIDMIATDHAPHSAEEKGRGLERSAMGIVGIECAFPLLYTELVKTGVISMERLLELMVYNPKKRFGIHDDGFTVFSFDNEYKINPDDFLSKGKATPFLGKQVFGECLLTVSNRKIAYKSDKI
jgi:dihydroorotase